MTFLAETTAPHLLILPEGWYRISLDTDNEQLDAEVKRIAKTSVSSDVPRDQRPLAAEAIRRYLRGAIQDAKVQGMQGVALPVGTYASGIAMPLAVTDFEYDAIEERELPISLSMMRAGMLRNGRNSTVVDIGSMRAVRTLMTSEGIEVEGQEVDARTTAVVFAIPIPGQDTRWKGIQFSFTVPNHISRDADRSYVAVADVMIRSFRFLRESPDEPSVLEDRIALALHGE